MVLDSFFQVGLEREDRAEEIQGSEGLQATEERTVGEQLRGPWECVTR